VPANGDSGVRKSAPDIYANAYGNPGEVRPQQDGTGSQVGATQESINRATDVPSSSASSPTLRSFPLPCPLRPLPRFPPTHPGVYLPFCFLAREVRLKAAKRARVLLSRARAGRAGRRKGKMEQSGSKNRATGVTIAQG